MKPLFEVLASGEPGVQAVAVVVDPVRLDFPAFGEAMAVLAHPTIKPRTANITTHRRFPTLPISPP